MAIARTRDYGGREPAYIGPDVLLIQRLAITAVKDPEPHALRTVKRRAFLGLVQALPLLVALTPLTIHMQKRLQFESQSRVRWAQVCLINIVKDSSTFVAGPSKNSQA